jgi:hypothetical protein
MLLTLAMRAPRRLEVPVGRSYRINQQTKPSSSKVLEIAPIEPDDPYGPGKSVTGHDGEEAIDD